MNLENEILLIPDKKDQERDRLAEVWKNKGGEVKRIGKFWIKPEVENKKISIYGYDSFCLVLAQLLEIKMLMPKDEIIAELENKFIKRKIEIKKIKEISEIKFPKFLKPVTPKLFKAEIFHNKEELKSKIHDIEETERLICSEIITVSKEVRSFILDNKIIDLAYYEGEGKLEDPKIFINNFLKDYNLNLPKTFVLDIGYNEINGWFIIEFNSSWGAGLNFCDPNKVFVCIREAAIN